MECLYFLVEVPYIVGSFVVKLKGSKFMAPEKWIGEFHITVAFSITD